MIYSIILAQYIKILSLYVKFYLDFCLDSNLHFGRRISLQYTTVSPPYLIDALAVVTPFYQHFEKTRYSISILVVGLF